MTGILNVRVLQANLTRDLDTISKMDPYTIIKIGSYQVQTSTKHSQGKHPIWNEIFTFFVVDNNTLEFEIWDYDSNSKDDCIGKGSLQIQAFKQKEKTNEWYEIKNKNKNAGKIALDIEYIALQDKNQEEFEENILNDLNDVKKQSGEDLEKQQEKMKQQIETLKNKLKNSYSEMIALSTELDNSKQALKKAQDDKEKFKEQGFKGNFLITQMIADLNSQSTDLYCYLNLSDGNTIKTKICEKIDNKSAWKDQLILSFRNISSILVEVYESSIGYDTLIGVGSIAISQFYFQEKTTFIQFNIYLQEKLIGEMKLEISHVQESIQQK